MIEGLSGIMYKLSHMNYGFGHSICFALASALADACSPRSRDVRVLSSLICLAGILGLASGRHRCHGDCVNSDVTGYCFFFFQAEDGIRDYKVTGVQTCALPIYAMTEQAMHGTVAPASTQ